MENGCRDITLLGQNVNSYGKGLDEPCSFAELLRMVNAIPGDFHIRFMTSHPKDCTHELLDAMAECDKVCKHLHLPVQSGSDRILTAMNRHYDLRHYEELLRYAREKCRGFPSPAILLWASPEKQGKTLRKRWSWYGGPNTARSLPSSTPGAAALPPKSCPIPFRPRKKPVV